MIEIHIRLFGILRDILPAEAKGRMTLQLPDGTTVQDVLAHFGITQLVSFAVNDEIDLDTAHQLKDGDRLEFFRISAGG